MASKPSVSNFKASPAEKILVLALMASAFLLFSLFLHPAYGILVYPDELRYVELARNIAAGRGLLIRNLNLDYQKILYPLFLAPAFLVASDLRQAYHLIFALNLALLVSTTLPVYLLSLQLVRKPANRILIAAFTSFSFPMLYSQTIMTESLYIPLSAWTFYALYVFLKNRSFPLSCVLGVLFYLNYLCKEIALSYPLALGFLLLYEVLRGKGKRAESLKLLLGFSGTFALAFALMKLTAFAGAGNSYHQMDLASVASLSKVGYMFYSGLYYLLFILIALGFVPVVRPLLRGGLRTREEKKLWQFLALSLLISVATIAYTILAREEYPSLTPRIHMRYISQFFYPFLVLYFAANEWDEEQPVAGTSKWGTGFCLGLLVLIVVFLRSIGAGPAVDYTELFYFPRIKERLEYFGCAEPAALLIVRLWISLSFLGILALHARGRHKPALALFSLFLCFIGAWNFYFGAIRFEKAYALTYEETQEVVGIGHLMTELAPSRPLVLLRKGSESYLTDRRLLDSYLPLGADFANLEGLQLAQPGDAFDFALTELPCDSDLGAYPADAETDFVICAGGVALTEDSGTLLAQTSRFRVYALTRPGSLRYLLPEP